MLMRGLDTKRDAVGRSHFHKHGIKVLEWPDAVLRLDQLEVSWYLSRDEVQLVSELIVEEKRMHYLLLANLSMAGVLS